MGTRQRPLDHPDAVTQERQGSGCGDAGIELAQSARRGVARIREGLLAACPLSGIELIESRVGHEHFTADFQGTWPSLAAEAPRHRVNGANVLGYFLAATPIAAGGRALESALAIQETGGQTVELGLHHVLEGVHSESLPNPAIELTHLLRFESVAE